jgi:hypothetical protein
MSDAATAEVIEDTVNEEPTDAELAAEVFPGQFEATEDEPAEEKSSAKAADKPAEGKPAKATEALANDALFDDKALSTKQGIAAARKALTDARKEIRETEAKTNDVYVRTKRREARAKTAEAEGQRYEKAARALHAQVLADVDILFNGNAEQVVETLGKLTRRNGADVYEQMSAAIIANGKSPKPQRDPEVAALREEITRLKTALQEDAKQKEFSAARADWINETVEVIKDPEKFPGMAHQIAEGNGEELVELLDQRKQEYWAKNKRVLPDAQLFADIEAKLVRFAPPREAKKDPKAAKVAPKRLPGEGVNPAKASQAAGGSREMTEEERFEDLVNDKEAMGKIFNWIGG